VSPETGTVVVVEDDPHIADLVDLYLRREGFRVLLAGDGETGLEHFVRDDPCIVILDVGLPGARDGFDVCRDIRARSNVPVLFLTARDEEVDRILGLELGADDYLVKPFSPRELVARVRAILRRTREGPAPQEVITLGELEVDMRRREARHAGADARSAAVAALGATAGTVTSAAAVMVAVFAIFATLHLLEFKQLGFGLAVAILLDATIVRAVALPAVVTVLGARSAPRRRAARFPQPIGDTALR